ncbi:hypothetical protein D0Z07_5499 [Hyphodiscus hymeniophilus]|uniref:Uncharacterized protein n=1 Tax=Hyphodiscus hymeniophilus TaxID=353542 RepID=A0A9P6VID9_9HELO|nr:hypothetical protein D0Z07_5499 [Hyphodiscus hymeniophilus]
MPDTAQINRSLSSIKTELEFLRDSNVLSPPQFQSIMAQLPGQNGAPSQYIDKGFSQPQQQFNPGQLAQQAQDPNNAAHPQNPKVSSLFYHFGFQILEHHEWVRNMASKFGNAAMFGAGATFGGDMVNDALKQF